MQTFASSFGIQTIPGAVSSIQVQASNAGLATTGVLMLVGEADAGPDFSLESDLSDNSFGPDQFLAVASKYKSGTIVDAFRAAVAPMNDPAIQGSFSRAIVVKTNPSTAASAVLPDIAGSTTPGYGTLTDLSFGKLGNLIYSSIVASPAEVVPTTGTIFFVVPTAANTFNVRVDGGAATVLTIDGTATRATVLTALNAIAGITAVAGAGTDDLTISHSAGAVVPGFGKSIEIQRATGTDKVFVTTSAGTIEPSWAAAGALITSGSEYGVQVNVSRQLDGVSEVITVAGDTVLQVGYTGTTATATVTSTTFATTVVGGTGASMAPVHFADFPTIGDLAAFIGAQPGHTAKVASPIVASLPSTVLDQGTFNICTSTSGQPGRIKAAAYRFQSAIASVSAAVQMPTRAAAGLPGTMTTKFFTGGTRGATTGTNVASAIDALTKVRGNFLIPLFSRDATADLVDGLTDPNSTYTIDGINALANSHCIAMSKPTEMKHRQAFLSKQTSFSSAQVAATTIASARSSMAFQNVKAVASDGTIRSFQPWMGAVVAAASQAAGFYKAIFNKTLNISGALQTAGDWNDIDNSAVTSALQSGLLPIRRSVAGGYRFVSDQTTYSRDSNFVFNSIQAVYGADVIATTTAQRLEDAFVGQSLADVSAPIVLAYVEAVMDSFISLKLITGDDQAPRGYRNVVVTINGPAIQVSLEIKLAGAVYFIPISFSVSQVTQTARG